MAGTAEINGFSRDIRQARIDPLLDWCQELFPNMSTRSYVPWAGLRPMMPDMMPVVRAGRAPGVFYNTGHGHLGVDAVCGDIVAGRGFGRKRGWRLSRCCPQAGAPCSKSR